MAKGNKSERQQMLEYLAGRRVNSGEPFLQAVAGAQQDYRDYQERSGEEPPYSGKP